jgi:hypothetical protein
MPKETEDKPINKLVNKTSTQTLEEFYGPTRFRLIKKWCKQDIDEFTIIHCNFQFAKQFLHRRYSTELACTLTPTEETRTVTESSNHANEITTGSVEVAKSGESDTFKEEISGDQH